MIAIVDYGVGNIFSLCSSFKYIGADIELTSDVDTIKRADKIIFPGVGAFCDAAQKLRQRGLDKILIEEAKSGKPFLGICLGMQMMLTKSYEFGEYDGLDIISGNVVPIENVIPKDGAFSMLIKQDDLAVVEKELADFNTEIKAEYAAADPNATLVMASAGVADAYVLDAESSEKLLTALNLMPNGVQAMCVDLPGLVETSLNMGVVSLTEDNLQMCFSVRSSVSTAKAYIAGKVTQMTEFLGGTVSSSGDYPAWPLARESKFRDQCVEVYKNLYGAEPQVVTIHAGLECGILSEKIPGLDCISMGPTTYDVHTVNEHFSLLSAERFWKLLIKVLDKI